MIFSQAELRTAEGWSPWYNGSTAQLSRGETMDLRAYQQQAFGSDRIPTDGDSAIIAPLLGLAGETGELLSEYKKHLRDRDVHPLPKERIAEELGDLLWYIANVASKFDLDLNDIAEKNLTKARDRWTEVHTGRREPFDRFAPVTERLPRQFDVQLTQTVQEGKVKTRAFVDGKQVGDDLTDNAYSPDGYRFHDVFHLAYAATLGWSPVTRKLLNRKRKTNTKVDEVEDGGRATAIEEGISAFVFEHSHDHNRFEGAKRVDSDLLKVIKNATRKLEVNQCTPAEWEYAILSGYAAWRTIEKNGGGWVRLDLDARTIVASADQLPARTTANDA
jgi:NTP pyrophosphatase (non-canonical NTP hydrolase)